MKVSLRRLLFAFGIGLLLALAACSPNEPATGDLSEATPPADAAEPDSTVPGSSPMDGFPRTLVDGIGTTLILEAPPQRIFSGAVAIDNILLEIADPSTVAAVTLFATDPVYSYVVDKVDENMMLVDALNPELVIAADPDLVLVASWNDADAIRQIQELGYPVYTFTTFGGLEDALLNIATIGALTGEEEAAQALIDQFYREYGQIAAAVAGRERPTVLYWNDWGSTTGTDTAVDSIIRYAGGINLAAEHGIEGWQVVDAEWILSLDPDVIITDAHHEFQARLADHPALSRLTAVRTNRVYYIDHMGALNHHFILAIEELARHLHPDAFVDQ